MSEAELRRYLEHPGKYRLEAVEAAVAELRRRGFTLDEGAWSRIQGDLQHRDSAAEKTRWMLRLLGDDPVIQTLRVRAVTAALLGVGLGSALVIRVAVGPEPASPLVDPMDTKKYLRDLELYGGQVNVLSTELMRWWDGLWHGRQLATTVAWLTVGLAIAFWFVARRQVRSPED